MNATFEVASSDLAARNLRMAVTYPNLSTMILYSPQSLGGYFDCRIR